MESVESAVQILWLRFCLALAFLRESNAPPPATPSLHSSSRFSVDSSHLYAKIRIVRRGKATVASDGGGARTGFSPRCIRHPQLPSPFVLIASVHPRRRQHTGNPTPHPRSSVFIRGSSSLHHSGSIPIHYQINVLSIPAPKPQLFLRLLRLIATNQLKCLSMNHLHIKLSSSIRAPSCLIVPNRAIFLTAVPVSPSLRYFTNPLRFQYFTDHRHPDFFILHFSFPHAHGASFFPLLAPPSGPTIRLYSKLTRCPSRLP